MVLKSPGRGKHYQKRQRIIGTRRGLELETANNTGETQDQGR